MCKQLAGLVVRAGNGHGLESGGHRVKPGSDTGELQAGAATACVSGAPVHGGGHAAACRAVVRVRCHIPPTEPSIGPHTQFTEAQLLTEHGYIPKYPKNAGNFR